MKPGLFMYKSTIPLNGNEDKSPIDFFKNDNIIIEEYIEGEQEDKYKNKHIVLSSTNQTLSAYDGEYYYYDSKAHSTTDNTGQYTRYKKYNSNHYIFVESNVETSGIDTINCYLTNYNYPTILDAIASSYYKVLNIQNITSIGTSNTWTAGILQREQGYPQTIEYNNKLNDYNFNTYTPEKIFVLFKDSIKEGDTRYYGDELTNLKTLFEGYYTYHIKYSSDTYNELNGGLNREWVKRDDDGIIAKIFSKEYPVGSNKYYWSISGKINDTKYEFTSDTKIVNIKESPFNTYNNTDISFYDGENQNIDRNFISITCNESTTPLRTQEMFNGIYKIVDPTVTGILRQWKLSCPSFDRQGTSESILYAKNENTPEEPDYYYTLYNEKNTDTLTGEDSILTEDYDKNPVKSSSFNIEKVSASFV